MDIKNRVIRISSNVKWDTYMYFNLFISAFPLRLYPNWLIPSNELRKHIKLTPSVRHQWTSDRHVCTWSDMTIVKICPRIISFSTSVICRHWLVQGAQGHHQEDPGGGVDSFVHVGKWKGSIGLEGMLWHVVFLFHCTYNSYFCQGFHCYLVLRYAILMSAGKHIWTTLCPLNC